ncbi:DUF417 family protein [Candidatus Woesearchaeota archaeon]|jgi:uncharacterized membrane protein YphA (DoxX/SURF4 family)|nr:DUF417 family protein [Candidatus Woesearchaeota archaeon]MBT3537505.1 DUF417 family protein [Candidatus Woesearchaeota archaeon]MBT4696809.1 DUF417 family protein [Candidatus Woesearchaeota archaeon]MBT4717630.1 DUF417 family protein [Candidatus Woesearchaeota archaeon]MBT7106185.1 DUF417 family protein [Candidatus Woesearchaeota archaeon]
MAFSKWCEKYGMFFLRISFGIISLWFGLISLLDPSSLGVFVNGFGINAVGVMSLIVGVAALLLSVMFFIGFFTKVAAIVAIVISVIGLVSLFLVESFKTGFPYLSTLGAFLVKDFIVLAAAFVLASAKDIPLSLDNLFK